MEKCPSEQGYRVKVQWTLTALLLVCGIPVRGRARVEDIQDSILAVANLGGIPRLDPGYLVYPSSYTFRYTACNIQCNV